MLAMLGLTLPVPDGSWWAHLPTKPTRSQPGIRVLADAGSAAHGRCRLSTWRVNPEHAPTAVSSAEVRCDASGGARDAPMATGCATWPQQRSHL
jgi:hypothetical protein